MKEKNRNLCLFVVKIMKIKRNNLFVEDAPLILPFYIDYREPIKKTRIICGEIVLTEPYIDLDDYNYEKELSCHVCGGYYPRKKQEKTI